MNHQINQQAPASLKTKLAAAVANIYPANAAPVQYPPLDTVTKPNLTTAEAAHYLNRAQQTMRAWAMRDGIEGLRPTRINGRLAWCVADIRKLLGQGGFANIALMAGVAAVAYLAPGLIDLTSIAMLGAAGVIKFTEADTAARAGAAIAENCLDAMNGLDDQADHANVLAKGLIDLQKLKHHEHAAAGFSGALIDVIERGLRTMGTASQRDNIAMQNEVGRMMALSPAAALRRDHFINIEIPSFKPLNAEQNRILDAAFFAQEHGEDVFWLDVAEDIQQAADNAKTPPLPWQKA